jgi:hypothetical protein
MTLQELKTAIFKDEEEFIIEMHRDVNSSIGEIKEDIKNLKEDIDSYQTPEELISFYINRGWNERDAYQQILSYLIEN